MSIDIENNWLTRLARDCFDEPAVTPGKYDDWRRDDDTPPQLPRVDILPTATCFSIAAMCLRHSTDTHECHARIEWVNGKPVATLVSVPRDQLPPNFLRPNFSGVNS